MTVKTTGGRRKLNNVEELSIKRGVSVKMVYDQDKNYAKDSLGNWKRLPAIRTDRNGIKYSADRSVLI
jgi:hypothetical protein